MKYLILKRGGNNDENRRARKVQRFSDKMASTIADALVNDDLTPLDLLPTITLLDARCRAMCLEQMDEAMEEEAGDDEDYGFN